MSDRDANRVYRITTSGRLLAVVGGLGQAPGRFRLPTGIAVDNTGRTFVSDLYNNRIQEFDKQLHFMCTVAPGVPRPAGVAPDGRGGLWVSSGEFTGGRFPLLHVSAGGMVTGNAGPPLAGFPTYDGRGRVWITDRGGSPDPVMSFTYDGRILSRWGGTSIKLPEATAVAGGLVFIGERGRVALDIFDDHGRRVGSASLSDLRNPSGMSEGPYGLAVDRQGFLWACMLNGGAVVRYRVVESK